MDRYVVFVLKDNRKLLHGANIVNLIATLSQRGNNTVICLLANLPYSFLVLNSVLCVYLRIISWVVHTAQCPLVIAPYDSGNKRTQLLLKLL